MKHRSLCLSLALSGCAALQPAPRIVQGRYATETVEQTLIPHPIDFSVSSSEADTDGSKGIAITALSDRGQAALIATNNGKPPVQLKPGSKAATSVEMGNTLKRRLSVSILPADFLPDGDRIEALHVELSIVPPIQRPPTEDSPSSPPSPSWQIVNWSQASDTRNVIDVGKLTGVTESKINASAGLKIADVLPSLTLGAERSRTDTAELEVKDTSNFNAGVTQTGTAFLVERAGYADDLSHTLSIDVTAASPDIQTIPIIADSFSSLYKDKDGVAEPVKGTLVRLQEISVYTPVVGQLEPICGLATLHYRLRHILTGRSTTPESDDRIDYVPHRVAVGFMFSPPPFSPMFIIKARQRDLEYRLGRGASQAPPSRLQFASLEEATAFREWLLQPSVDGAHLADATLGYSRSGHFEPLTYADTADLVVAPANGAAMWKAAAGGPKDCPIPPDPEQSQ